MTKTKIKELSKGDHVRFASRWSQEEPIIATVKRIVTDMTHYRDVAYVKTWDGKEGVLTDNDSWVFVGGKVDDDTLGNLGDGGTLFADKVSNMKQNKPNDVQQKKHLRYALDGKEQDIINKPSHYTYGKIEVIEIVEQVTTTYPVKIAFSIGNALKYICRAPFKNGVEDLKKAVWYLERAIEKWDVK